MLIKQFISILCSIVCALALQAQQEGWFDGQAERVEPGSFIEENHNGGGGMMPLAASSPVTVQADDSDLVELACGLQHDPVRIFNHVRDHIAYTPYYGLLKGAQQTLLERSGNDFDQAALLFRLLELSGYAPVYGYGAMVMPFFNPKFRTKRNRLGQCTDMRW